jgi:hypothetical protein
MNRIITFFFLVFIVSISVYSQSDTTNFRELVEKIKIEKMVNKMGLDKSTEQLFIERYKIFSGEIKNLNKQRNKLIKKIERSIDNENELDSLLDMILEIEQNITTKRKEFKTDLKTFLTNKQIATMLIFERHFAIELRKLIKEYKKENKKNKN